MRINHMFWNWWTFQNCVTCLTSFSQSVVVNSVSYVPRNPVVCWPIGWLILDGKDRNSSFLAHLWPRKQRLPVIGSLCRATNRCWVGTQTQNHRNLFGISLSDASNGKCNWSSYSFLFCSNCHTVALWCLTLGSWPHHRKSSCDLGVRCSNFIPSQITHVRSCW